MSRAFTEFLQDLKISFPPRRVSNLTPRLIELADKLNMLGLLCTLRQNGKLDSPFEQQALLQELEKKNVGYERYLEKKAEALQDSINKQKELVQELMEMSKIGHEKLMEAMLIDFDKMLELYHKLDLLRQEIERLEKQLELIQEQLTEVMRKLTEIATDITIAKKRLTEILTARSNKTNELKQLSLQLLAVENNSRQKYTEIAQGRDLTLPNKFIDVIIEYKKNPGLATTQSLPQALHVISNDELKRNEVQHADAVLNLNTAEKLITELQDELVVVTKQYEMKQITGLSQEEIALSTKEITDLENKIKKVEKDKSNTEKLISKYDEERNDLKLVLANLEKLFLEQSLKNDLEDQELAKTSSEINEVKEEIERLDSKETNLNNKVTKLTEIQKSLKLQDLNSIHKCNFAI